MSYSYFSIYISLAGYLAKVGDFGICCEHGKPPPGATPYYSAPEACLCRPVIPKSDVYSVGIIAILLLSGQLKDSEVPDETCDTYINGHDESSFWTQALCTDRSGNHIT